MNAFQACSDISDAIELFPLQGLYLKPIARLNVSVQLPLIKVPGKTISNWEVMEKLRNMVKPEEFTVLKVAKSTLEFIRFEGEIESKSKLPYVIGRLDGRTIKLNCFTEPLKIRAAEAKISFPTRHTWDSYFRDAKNMNEMKAGERPDTIHISNLPCKWFAAKQDVTKGNDKPSEYIFRKVFEVFGDVRCVDIPAADPYRNKMKANISGIKIFSFGQELCFEGYVQFKEYICFVKAMDSLRGMKLLYRDGDNAFTANVKVDFDKTKHLSESSIRRRRIEREKLMALERENEERERMEQELEQQRMEQERKREKSSKSEKQKQLKEKKERDTEDISKKIALEERKLLIAQRKLESIRLLDELFERIKRSLAEQSIAKQEGWIGDKKQSEDVEEEDEKKKRELLHQKERELRCKLVHRYQNHQKHLDEQHEHLQQTLKRKGPSTSQEENRIGISDSERISNCSLKSCSSNNINSTNCCITPRKKRRKWTRKTISDKEGSHTENYQSQDDRYYHGHPPSERSYPRSQYKHHGVYFDHSQQGQFCQQRASFSSCHRYERTLQEQTYVKHYYEEVSKEYYRYFHKLAKQESSDIVSQSCGSASSRSSARSVLSNSKSHRPRMKSETCHKASSSKLHRPKKGAPEVDSPVTKKHKSKHRESSCSTTQSFSSWSLSSRCSTSWSKNDPKGRHHSASIDAMERKSNKDTHRVK